MISNRRRTRIIYPSVNRLRFIRLLSGRGLSGLRSETLRQARGIGIGCAGVGGGAALDRRWWDAVDILLRHHLGRHA
jgi:hypothetical protein